MTTLPNFEWNRIEPNAASERGAGVAERRILVAEVPRHSMTMRLFLIPSAEAERFTVCAWTCIEDARPSFWAGSRPVTRAEFDAVDDPYRYGHQFVTCVRDGLDLVCTPWSYRYSWEGPQGMGARRGEPVRIVGALRVSMERASKFSPKLLEFVGFVDYRATLAQVCELVRVSPAGRTLRASESGRAWTLELSSTTSLGRVG